MLKFFDRRKESASNSFSFLQTDVHSHLIPGLDDGSKNIQTSLSLIKSLYNLGFTKLITTPHIMQDYYPNKAEEIADRVKELQKDISREGIPVSIQSAAEYFLDENIEELLRDGDLLTVREMEVLVEIPFVGAPFHLRQMLFNIQVMGYQPILAHPERYEYFWRDLEQLREIRKNGCLFQVNLNSFGGYYGKYAKEMAFKLLKEGLVDYAGSDLHHIKHLIGLKKLLQNRKVMGMLYGYEKWRNPLL